MAERVMAQGQYNGDQHGPVQSGKGPEDYAPEEMSWEESRSMGGYGGPDSKKRRGVGHNLALSVKSSTDVSTASRSSWAMS
jgi:hypothetical protein